MTSTSTGTPAAARRSAAARASASEAMVPISSGGVSTMRAARRTAAAFAAGPYAAADASSGPPSAVAKETRTVFSAAASSDGFFWSKSGKARAMAHAAGAACDADSSTEMMAAPPGLPAPLAAAAASFDTACPRTGELCREQCSGSTPATTVLHVPSLLTMVVDAVAPSSPGFASSTSARHTASGTPAGTSFDCASSASLRPMMTVVEAGTDLKGSKVSAVMRAGEKRRTARMQARVRPTSACVAITTSPRPRARLST